MQKFLLTGGVMLAMVMLSLMAGGRDVARAQGPVAAGYDLLETDPSATQFDFQHSPIPPDFFCPGSQPFSGVVPLQGVPFDQFDPGTGPVDGLAPTDTIIERLQDAGQSGFPDTIQIQIVQLQLQSVAPITVTGGTCAGDWDLEVVIPPNDPNQVPGQMTIRHDQPNGGTFDAQLPVIPILVFTQVSNPSNQQIFDWAFEGLPPIDFVTPGPVPWCHDGNPLLSPAFNVVTVKPGLTSNFFPGIECIPDLIKNYFPLDAFFGGNPVGVHSVRPTETLAPHFKCYIITDAAVGATPTVETQFGTETLTVGQPEKLCPPTVKNGEGFLPQFEQLWPHLKCYDVTGQDPTHVVDLDTQFGTQAAVGVGPAEELCVPAIKSVVSPVPEPGSGPLPDRPNYVCHQITGLDPSITVDLENQFGLESAVPVNEPVRLCAPALVDGVGDLTLPHLKCHDIDGHDPPHVVDLETIFPLETGVDVELGDWLCLPAYKTVVGFDDDNDDYTNTEEAFITTDPNDDCPDNTSDDAWPPDYNNDATTDIFDINVLKPAFFTAPPNPAYSVRLDLTTDSLVDIFDVNRLKPVFFVNC